MTGEAGTATIRALGVEEATARVGELADLIVDAVANGASVNFLRGFSREDGVVWWRRAVLADLAAGSRILLVAEVEGRLVGTVQVILASQPNQPHRADVGKMLVHSSARRAGLGARLLSAAEEAARARGRTLLTLDTETGSAGERLYARGGWIAIGAIPGYALTPDGVPAAATFFYKPIV